MCEVRLLEVAAVLFAGIAATAAAQDEAYSESPEWAAADDPVEASAANDGTTRSYPDPAVAEQPAGESEYARAAGRVTPTIPVTPRDPPAETGPEPEPSAPAHLDEGVVTATWAGSVYAKGTAGAALAGKHLTNSPEWVGQLGANLRTPRGCWNTDVFANVVGRYQSEVNTGADLNPNKAQPGFTLVNGRVGPSVSASDRGVAVGHQPGRPVLQLGDLQRAGAGRQLRGPGQHAGNLRHRYPQVVLNTAARTKARRRTRAPRIHGGKRT